MSYDQSAPAQGHVVLSDVDAIRNNGNALRSFESSLSTAPPSNPVAGQFWWTTDTKGMYQRKQDNTAWTTALWYETDPPVLTTTFNNHSGANITSAVTVHGIRQGTGNGLDADLLDGQHASAFLGSSHSTATSSIHGVGAGSIVGTTLTQTLTNKTLDAPTISSSRERLYPLDGGSNFWWRYSADDSDVMMAIARLGTNSYQLWMRNGGINKRLAFVGEASGANTIGEDQINWSAAGGISQGRLLYQEYNANANTYTTVANVMAYIPANANSLEYLFKAAKDSTIGYPSAARMKQGATTGTELVYSSSSYTWTSSPTTGTINISALSGWVEFEIQVRSTDPVAHYTYLADGVFRII